MTRRRRRIRHSLASVFDTTILAPRPFKHRAAVPNSEWGAHSHLFYGDMWDYEDGGGMDDRYIRSEHLRPYVPSGQPRVRVASNTLSDLDYSVVKTFSPLNWSINLHWRINLLTQG